MVFKDPSHPHPAWDSLTLLSLAWAVYFSSVSMTHAPADKKQSLLSHWDSDKQRHQQQPPERLGCN